MPINLEFDQSASSNPQFEAVAQSVADFYNQLFNVPGTINIAVGWGEIGGSPLGPVLGSSTTSFQDVSVPNGTVTYISQAEAIAMGISHNTGEIDGYVGFSSTEPFCYNVANGVPNGEFDLWGTVAHEISEVLGRVSLLPYNNQSLMDEYRYSAPGVQDTSLTQPGYFSLDGGITNLGNWNVAPGGDLGDWAQSMGPDSFDAFGYPGVVNGMSSNDLMLMEALGYNVAALPTLYAFNLTTGHFPTLNTLEAQENSGLTPTQLAAADIGSQTFANLYNSGVLIDPGSPVTAQVVEELYQHALGHSPTQTTLNGWINSGMSMTDAFEAFVNSATYEATTEPAALQALIGILAPGHEVTHVFGS